MGLPEFVTPFYDGGFAGPCPSPTYLARASKSKTREQQRGASWVLQD